MEHPKLHLLHKTTVGRAVERGASAEDGKELVRTTHAAAPLSGRAAIHTSTPCHPAAASLPVSTFRLPSTVEPSAACDRAVPRDDAVG